MIDLLVTPPKRVVESKPVVLIGTCPDADALRYRKPLATAQMSVLEQALHMGGLLQSEVEIINIFPESTSVAPFWKDSTQARARTFKPAAQPYLEQLQQTLSTLQPRVVVPLGEIPTRAILGRHDYTKIRGYPFPTEGRIVIPSLHPKDMIWSNYEWRFYLSNDLQRAKGFADGVLKVDEPNLVILSTISDVCDYLDEIIEKKPPTAFDIEVSNFEVSCIGFSGWSQRAFTIPIDDRWTEHEEVMIWRKMASVLENPLVTKITQNGLFDTYFLAYKNGIFCKGVIQDTMIAHSISWPSFLKGLGFLGSIHTTYTYWKDQLTDLKGFKEED